MKKNENFFKKFRILPKLLCVISAFVIWLYVAAVENPDHEETIYQVPIKLVGVSTIETNNNLSVFSGYDLTVDLTVKGQLSTINKYNIDDYNVTCDISSVDEGGRYTFDLSFDMPSGVNLVTSSTNTASLYIDERTQTTVSVYPKLTSVTVSDNFELGELVADTETVGVSGPKSLIDEIDYAAVYLDAGKLTSSVTMVGQLSLVNISGEDINNPYVKISKSEVKVTVPLYSFKELKVNVPTRHGFYNDDNCKITVTPEVVAVKGDPNVLEKYSTIDTTVIDEMKITDDCEMILGLQIPDKLTLASGETSNISVNIQHKGTEIRTIAVDKFQVEGAEGLDYSVQTASLNVVLRGKEKPLGKLDKEDITVTVDLSGITDTTGTITAPVTITVKGSNNTIYAVGEYSVQVKIS